MGAYLESLKLFETVLFVISVSATVILIIQTILALFGIGEDGDLAEDAGGDIADIADSADVGDIGDIEIPDAPEAAEGSGGVGKGAFDAQGMRLFTIRGIVAFLMVGSWVGFVASRAGIHEFIAVVFALISGTVSLFGMAKLMQALMGLNQDGSLRVKNALGQIGTVYIKIPGGEAGVGKVNVMVQERLCEFDAVTESGDELKTGETVYVTDIRPGNVLVVEGVREN